MCQEESVTHHQGYARFKLFKMLKAKDGSFLIGHYTSKRKENNELIKKVFDALWEENKPQKTLEELIEKVEQKNDVSISIEEVEMLSAEDKNLTFVVPQPRKMYIFITRKVA
ncbi:MAG: hypothetical protein J6A04_06695 [Clostridia bacterium]|nr:hypothetical protein [Clostridia bacterium]